MLTSHLRGPEEEVRPAASERPSVTDARCPERIGRRLHAQLGRLLRDILVMGHHNRDARREAGRDHESIRQPLCQGSERTPRRASARQLCPTRG
jgi:hypothetical protein